MTMRDIKRKNKINNYIYLVILALVSVSFPPYSVVVAPFIGFSANKSSIRKFGWILSAVSMLVNLGALLIMPKAFTP